MSFQLEEEEEEEDIGSAVWGERLGRNGIDCMQRREGGREGETHARLLYAEKGGEREKSRPPVLGLAAIVDHNHARLF